MKNQVYNLAVAAKITPQAKAKRLKTKDHKQRKSIKDLRKVLKSNEWNGDATNKTCPECKAKKKDGHLINCQIQLVLEITKRN